MDIVAVQLIKNLQRIDHKNQYFIFVNPDEDTGAVTETKNFKVIPLRKSPYPLWEQYYLPKAAREYKLDVLHCTSNTAPLRLKVPLVLTLHDIIYLEQVQLKLGTWYQRFGNLYRRWVVPRIVNHCHTIYTVSPYEKELIDKHFGFSAGKVKVIHNGVASHFKPYPISAVNAIKSKYRLPERYILFLGNSDPKKNMGGMLQALLILDQSQKLSFGVVIPDLEEEHLMGILRDMDALSLRDKIHLPGYVPNGELPYFYCGAQVFVYPSLRESFGLPILEAMACGCPVITSNTSSMPGVAGGAALLVNPKKPVAISEAIFRVIMEKNLREELIEKGTERSTHFSFLKGAKSVLDTYQSIKRKRP